MRQIVTTGIVLSRTDYGEADRILTILTPDNGKLRLIAKGVRRERSKLAGGIELFSVSNITFIRGRGEIGTLISTRLIKHYGYIVKDIERVQTGYELIKRLNKITEDEPGAEYFTLLEQAFVALNDLNLNIKLISCWFDAQLLRYDGHTPNLSTELNGRKLSSNERFSFDAEAATFSPSANGYYDVDSIKLLRLLLSGNSPKVLNQVRGLQKLLPFCDDVLQQMLHLYTNI